ALRRSACAAPSAPCPGAQGRQARLAARRSRPVGCLEPAPAEVSLVSPAAEAGDLAPLPSWSGRRRAPAPIVSRPRAADRAAGTGGVHHGGQLDHGRLDHRVDSLPPSALSAGSPSKSADSFDWISITFLALSSSRSTWASPLRSRTTSRSRGSVSGRPRFWARPAKAP